MKKLNKLQINPEKVMKNEELVTLKGGGEGDYGSNNGSAGGGGGACTCKCYKLIPQYTPLGYLVSQSGDCNADCYYAFGWNATGACGW